jgi:hypothetical protein
MPSDQMHIALRETCFQISRIAGCSGSASGIIISEKMMYRAEKGEKLAVEKMVSD